MSFEGLLSHTVTVSKLVATTGNRKEFNIAATGIKTLIQPLSAEQALAQGMSFGRAYTAYFLANTDIQIGDRITDTLGRDFIITGMRKYNYGNIPHLAAVLDREIKANQQ